MRKTFLTGSAIVALALATPIFAQDATPIDPNAAPKAQTLPAAPGDTATAPAVKLKFIGQQADTELLASALIGSTVFNPADESLGDVNDVILATSGVVDAIVVGVGGFLGIGEKNVAVSFDAIQNTTDADGNVKLILDATKEELDAAPGYVTLAMLKQEELDKQSMNNTAPPVPTQ